MAHNVNKAFRVCIVGSGPGGFYTAAHLLKHCPLISGPGNPTGGIRSLFVDLVERLPHPYGLIQYGIAPDHPEVRHGTQIKFAKLMNDHHWGSRQIRFYGGVPVGGQDGGISLDILRQNYDAVVLAYGAQKDRTLGIAGEEAGMGANIFSSSQFVGWYNSHPDHLHHLPDLESSDTAVLIGHGNVALDIARILLKPWHTFLNTEISPMALDKLRQSQIRHVVLLGRRGPLQSSFTTKEVRELIQLPNTKLFTDIDQVELALSSLRPIPEDRPKKRLLELIASSASKDFTAPLSDQEKSVYLKFMSSPTALILNSSNNAKPPRVSGVQYVGNEMVAGSVENPSQAKVKAVLGSDRVIPCGLVVSCIGYASAPIPGLPSFNHTRHIINNDRGRVVSSDEHCVPGLYAAGWVKTGPRGVIASTRFDAIETAESILEDVEVQRQHWLKHTSLDFPRKRLSMEEILKQSGIQKWKTWSDWENVNFPSDNEQVF